MQNLFDTAERRESAGRTASVRLLVHVNARRPAGSPRRSSGTCRAQDRSSKKSSRRSSGSERPRNTERPTGGDPPAGLCFVKQIFRNSSSDSFGSQRESFSDFTKGPRGLAFLPVSQHERIRDAAALALELHQPAVVHDPVHQRRCQLVVRQHRAPLPELDVGRQHH